MPKPELKNRIQQFLLDKESEFKTSFLNSIHIAQETPETICITFPHLYFREWFHARVRHEFEHIVLTLDQNIKHIKYEVLASTKGNSPFALFRGDAQKTFKNYFYNGKNYFPFLSAFEFATKNEFSLNPFIVCGQNGSGKTHLITSMANCFFEDQRHEKIFFCTTNELNYYYHAKIKNSFEFIKKILEFDCLILDDIQDIQNFKTLQDDIVSIIDRYHERGKPMIFACCDKPAAQESLNSKLQSRLEGGFITHLDLPDLDIRITYIKQRCHDLKLELSASQILEIAQSCQDFKTLSKLMINLLTRKDLAGQDHIQDCDVRSVIEEYSPHPVLCNARTVLNTVADHFNLDIETLTSTCRTRDVVFARQIAMTLCRELLHHSYTQIGHLFGGKNHSSVLHSIKKINTLQKDNHETKNLLKELKKKVSSSGS